MDKGSSSGAAPAGDGGSTPTKLAELVALAHEPSSARRRELLREITDLFFANATAGRSEQEQALFEGVLSKLAFDLEEEVRVELAQRIADKAVAPTSLIRRLANDSISVAGPILEKSRVLSEEDLLGIVRTRGQDHLRAVSDRRGLSEQISEVIVERGDDVTLGVLIRNETATLSRASEEIVVARAADSPELQEAVVDRKSLPLDLLNSMYFMVESKLRQRILDRNESVDPAILETALNVGRNRLAQRDGALPPDYEQAEADIRKLTSKGPISSSTLAGFSRSHDTTRFWLAMAETTGLDFHTVKRIFVRRELDALAIICKASDLERPLFLTFAMSLMESGEAMRLAHEYGALYDQLPKDVASRTLRFWRVRRDQADAIAA